MGRAETNQPSRYDRARVDTLEPVRQAIEHLGLPFIQLRRLTGILNALTMQVEFRGDSPEVNQLLLDALRTALHHQVGEQRARAVLQAITVFEQAESVYWEQARAGSLPPIKLSVEDKMGDLIHEGYRLIEARQEARACDLWLEAWEILKEMVQPTGAENPAAGSLLRDPLLLNWAQDLELELHNAGLDDAVYHDHRVRYAREFLALFPALEADYGLNFWRAQGEALWHLGRRDEAEAAYAATVERFPDEGWAYIAWADPYWLYHSSPKEYARAEAIMKRALQRPRLRDRDDVMDRLARLSDEQDDQSRRATKSQRRPRSTNVPPTGKPGRNEPCWCGSGKKYKKCHLLQDEAQRRS